MGSTDVKRLPHRQVVDGHVARLRLLPGWYRRQRSRAVRSRQRRHHAVCWRIPEWRGEAVATLPYGETGREVLFWDRSGIFQ